LDEFLRLSLTTIKKMSNEGRDEFHFACKFTAYVGSELMEKMSVGQESYDRMLETKIDASDDSVLTKEQLIENLARRDITEYSD